MGEELRGNDDVICSCSSERIGGVIRIGLVALEGEVFVLPFSSVVEYAEAVEMGELLKAGAFFNSFGL